MIIVKVPGDLEKICLKYVWEIKQNSWNYSNIYQNMKHVGNALIASQKIWWHKQSPHVASKIINMKWLWTKNNYNWIHTSFSPTWLFNDLSNRLVFIKHQNYHHIEISQLICRVYQLTGFHMMASLAFNELRVSSRVSLISWGEGASLVLVGHPFSDDAMIKTPYGVDVLHRPASHPIVSYWAG